MNLGLEMLRITEIVFSGIVYNGHCCHIYPFLFSIYEYWSSKTDFCFSLLKFSDLANKNSIKMALVT